MQSRSLENIEIQGSQANDIKQSATWYETQPFSSFSFISVVLHLFVYLEMEIFSETVTYVCCSVLMLQDLSSDREVARENYSGVGKGLEPQRGVLKLRNVFIKKLNYLLCNVETLRRCDVPMSRC